MELEIEIKLRVSLENLEKILSSVRFLSMKSLNGLPVKGITVHVSPTDAPPLERIYSLFYQGHERESVVYKSYTQEQVEELI